MAARSVHQPGPEIARPVMTQQGIDIDQIAQPVGQIRILKQVSAGVEYLVLRAKHMEYGSRHRPRCFEQR